MCCIEYWLGFNSGRYEFYFLLDFVELFFLFFLYCVFIVRTWNLIFHLPLFLALLLLLFVLKISFCRAAW